MPLRVRDLIRDSSDVPACEAIVAGMPDYFGQEAGIAECHAALRSHSGLVVEDADGVAGFLTYQQHFPESAEISWMAVDRARHGRGMGTRLIETLVARLRQDGTKVLLVKTLSERHPDLGYARTRTFYRRHGFSRLEEMPQLWGESSPALLLVRALAPEDSEL